MLGSTRRFCSLGRKRTHLRGAPSSNTQLHSTFICGLALLYAVFLKPNALPLKDVFSAIKAASNTLFAYTSSSPSAGPLFEVFEELSAVCIDRMSRNDPPQQTEASKEWQKASQVAATNIGMSCVIIDVLIDLVDMDTTNEYADLMRSFGVDMDNEPVIGPDGFWDVSNFFTNNSV